MTPKARQFVAEFPLDFNATQAAIRAGYSAKTAAQAASRLLTNVEIADAIAEAVEKRAAQAEIDAAWVLKEAEDLYHDCRKANDRGNARSTAELIAKLIGLLGNKVTHDHTGKIEVVSGIPEGMNTGD